MAAPEDLALAAVAGLVAAAALAEVSARAVADNSLVPVVLVLAARAALYGHSQSFRLDSDGSITTHDSENPHTAVRDNDREKPHRRSSKRDDVEKRPEISGRFHTIADR